METNQIYELVNLAATEALGGQSTVQVQDTSSLVTLGNLVLNTAVESFLQTLMGRIYYTMFSFRPFEGKFKDEILSSEQYGMILQKLKASMPVAQSDPTYDLTDGQSVDMYEVQKPKVSQKLFAKRTPYQFQRTVQRKALQEAFLSPTAMDQFWAMIFGEVRNAIELSNDNLVRDTMNNYIANVAATAREVKLLTRYNDLSGAALVPGKAIRDRGFLGYGISQIKLYIKRLTDMSTQYNDGSETRHTPIEMQKIRILTEFINNAETVLQAETFNESFVRLTGYTELNYFQNAAPGNEMTIKVTPETPEGPATAPVTVENVIGCIYDRDALGVFRESTDALATPVNAKARYYNMFWFEEATKFNDLSENFILFTLN